MADISKIKPLGSNTTYNIKDNSAIASITRSGTTFTATRRDGTTFTFNQQDNNTWNSLSTSQAGYVAKAPNDTNKFLRGDATWAKVTWDNIDGKPTNFSPSTHTHGNITSDGTLQENGITIGDGDKILITDNSNSQKIVKTSISFDGTTTIKALTQKGTWETFLPLSGGTITGNINVIGNAAFNNTTTIDDAIINSLLVNGNSNFINNVNFIQIPTAPTAAAGTSTTQIATTEFVTNAVAQGFVANDAMVFKGLIGSNQPITQLPTSGYNAGWTYRVANAGIFAGEYCEVGDLLIAINDGPASGGSVINADWGKVEHNIDGAVFRGSGASNSSVGSSTQPVYVNGSGIVTAITGAIANDTTGNAATATQTKFLMNRGGSTVTIQDNIWNHNQTPFNHTNAATVWHQKWKQSGLTYTPLGGDATAITDSGDLVYWLSAGNTSNVLFLNMAIDGMIYAGGGFKGNLNGTATNATQLISNDRMDYGWNGINYFNISTSNQSAAKVNDTPFSSNVWTHILRFNRNDPKGYYTDLAIPFSQNSIYYKRIAAGSLQNSTTNGGWIKVLDQLNYTSYTVTKTGSGASGTWNINISGNAATATALSSSGTINQFWRGDNRWSDTLGFIKINNEIKIKGYGDNNNYWHTIKDLTTVPLTNDRWHYLPNTTGWIVTSPTNGTGNNTTPIYIGEDGITRAITGTISNNTTGNADTATTASKLSNTSKIGDTNKPVYFKADGTPAAINYTIATSVPSGAVFTDRYVNSAGFADDSTNTAASPVKMTLTRAGSDTVAVTANIPKVSSSSAGVAPKGTAVSSQNQSTKFLREDGTWAAPSYTVNTNTDTLVKQTAKSDNKNYKILFTTSDSPTSGNANEAAYDTGITINPSAHTLTATKFIGSLQGNAATATAASKLSNISAIGSSTQPVYFNSSGQPAAVNKYDQQTGKTTDFVPYVRGDGVMEIGKYIDFHNTSEDTSDYIVRITARDSSETDGAGLKLTGTTVGTFKGNLNGTATKATQDENGNNIINTYLTKTAGVTNITWDNTNKKLIKTINNSNSDIVTLYAANLKLNNTAVYNTELEIKNIKIGNGSTLTSTKNVKLEYNETLEVLNFVFS